MGLIAVVEPCPSGHRFQAVAHVATVAAEHGEVVLLTSAGAPRRSEYAAFIAPLGLQVREVFASETPSTADVARTVARLGREEELQTVVVLDADQALKRWWWDAPRAFGRRARPRIVFLVTRYPARLRATDWSGWRLRIPKATLALAAMATRTLHRVAGFAGRDDLAPGWIVKRTRDPAICSAHSRDRDIWRSTHGLPPSGRAVVGIFGGVSERKFPDLVWEAMGQAGVEADLLLAGGLSPGVRSWLDGVRPSPRRSVIVRDGFLENATLDQLIAASDVVMLVMTNNGPSGIQGKALAADVPVVTAGSVVRAAEARATSGGETAAFDAASIGAALTRALARRTGVDGSGATGPTGPPVPAATADAFARSLLGPPYDTCEVESS